MSLLTAQGSAPGEVESESVATMVESCTSALYGEATVTENPPWESQESGEEVDVTMGPTAEFLDAVR